MSIAFSPLQIGPMTIRNRFMRSATWEACAEEDGTPLPRLFKMMTDMAEGHVGLIVPGFANISKAGQAFPKQTGAFDKNLVEPWRPTLAKCHELGSKVMFQIGYGGVSCMDGACRGPSLTAGAKSEFTNAEIEELIEYFTRAAVVLAKIGADGVELHGAHGYTLSMFMSPLANKRTDKWGGSEEGRLRLVSEICESIKRATDPSFAIGIKMNGDDSIPSGMTKELCGRYVNMLKGKIDLFEISCGLFVRESTIRSKALNPSLMQSIKSVFNPLSFKTMYNEQIGAYVKKMNPWATIATVGGVRKLDEVNKALLRGAADLVSLSRPLLREPKLVRSWEEGTKVTADCKSCNLCIDSILRTKGGLRCPYP